MMIPIVCAFACGLSLMVSSAVGFSLVTGYPISDYLGFSGVIGLFAMLGGWILGRSLAPCPGSMTRKAGVAILSLVLSILAIIALVLMLFASLPNAMRLGLCLIGPLTLVIIALVRKALLRA